MPVNVYNFCYRYKKRITDNLKKKIRKAGSALAINNHNIFLYFVDWDPDWDEYRGGWHEYGQDGCVIHLEVGPVWMTPHTFLLWLACHELRHAHQSIYDLFQQPEHYEILDACLKKDGLKKPNKQFMRKWHDTLPEEVDADSWANNLVGIYGSKWWNECIEKKKRGCHISDYKIPNK